MYLRLKIEAVNDGMLVKVIRRLAVSVLEEIDADEESIDRLKRILGEACGNVVRHAYSESSMYEVSLDYSDASVRVTVRDYGCGFRPDRIEYCPDAHFGIQLMDEESESLRIESAPGKGTVVHAVVPVAPSGVRCVKDFVRLIFSTEVSGKNMLNDQDREGVRFGMQDSSLSAKS